MKYLPILLIFLSCQNTLLNKEEYFGKITNIENKDKEYFGSGSVALDWNGVFCFEVVE